MREEGKLHVSWQRLLLGILYIIVAIMGFRSPAGNVVALSFLYSILMLVRGAFFIYLSWAIKKRSGRKTGTLVVIGILQVIFSIFIMANPQISAYALGFLFAFWLLADSIGTLSFTWSRWNFIIPGRPIRTIFAIFGIFIGFGMLFRPLTSVLSLGVLISVYLLFGGILSIFVAFRREN